MASFALIIEFKHYGTVMYIMLSVHTLILFIVVVTYNNEVRALKSTMIFVYISLYMIQNNDKTEQRFL